MRLNESGETNELQEEAHRGEHRRAGEQFEGMCVRACELVSVSECVCEFVRLCLRGGG